MKLGHHLFAVGVEDCGRVVNGDIRVHAAREWVRPRICLLRTYLGQFRKLDKYEQTTNGAHMSV